MEDTLGWEPLKEPMIGEPMCVFVGMAVVDTVVDARLTADPVTGGFLKHIDMLCYCHFHGSIILIG